ncbi:aspartate--tRNA ligase [Williamwhitmania taraxaci]|uniref:Aspartate--tRNA ligase n=1 Tax=Williamwhitmania taraxaci TaxID=1640674 RepID=A0A1G6RCC2_9BACT|nr:aspartate--tRNA ligase [Williamwhitmania taraxaci]SDD01944.1 aspartyl-tRNA synthetase [Williamwhitmania taraxaci]
MYRTHTCGELNLTQKGQSVKLSGWVQRVRRLGGMTFVDLRDRYGITQLVCGENASAEVKNITESLGREFVIQATGIVVERSNKNAKMATGNIEIQLDELKILHKSEVPPFTIEDESDGGDEIRMKYRYLDLRRNPLQKAMALRHRMAQEVRHYLDQINFIEIETPYLIKSTPEGARDFVVPSRMNQGEFYALPQSPQSFKQLLMVSGFDRYFQIVRCFRDEDLRADRQPEFTQIDCEMAFVEQEDVLNTFEGMAKHLFKVVKGVDIDYAFPRMTYAVAMERYGSDKPDIRFGMEIHDLGSLARGKDFKVVDEAEFVGGICAPNCGEYSRKQLDELTLWVQRPQVGAKGLIYAKWQSDGTIKSSVDKFYSQEDLEGWFKHLGGKKGDLLLVLTGARNKMLSALGDLRLEMGNRLDLRPKDVFAPMWVVDFPLFEWDEETKRFYAMHHPFTSPKLEDIHLFESDPGKVRANAYDFVVNGVEIGGGSIRIHDSELQRLMFKQLGFTEKEAENQFGFIINAFRYGAPPHGGIAFGFDRWCAIFGGSDSIRDYIAFPKNNSGRDLMADSPSSISELQLKELALKLNPNS